MRRGVGSSISNQREVCMTEQVNGSFPSFTALDLFSGTDAEEARWSSREFTTSIEAGASFSEIKGGGCRELKLWKMKVIYDRCLSNRFAEGWNFRRASRDDECVRPSNNSMKYLSSAWWRNEQEPLTFKMYDAARTNLFTDQFDCRMIRFT